MRRPVFVILVVFLFLASAYCVLGCLGTAVSMKYEVDEPYVGDKLSDAEEALRVAKLDARQRELNLEFGSFAAGAIAMFLGAISLLAWRQRFRRKGVF